MLASHGWSARTIHDLGLACRAQALGLWSCPPGRLDLVCGWLIDQRLCNLLHTRWPAVVDKLRAAQRAALGQRVTLLPVHAPPEGLVGVLLFVGELPRSGVQRVLLERFQQQAGAALRPPLPVPDPDLLLLPLALADSAGGLRAAQRRVLEAVVARHGGSVTRTSQVVDEPRQTLTHRLQKLQVEPAAPPPMVRLSPANLEGAARELEREACREVMEHCRGDLKLAAALLHVTPDSWRVYLESLDVNVPRPPRRRRH